MKILTGDIETDGFNPSVIWCAYFIDHDTRETWLFTHPIAPEELQALADKYDRFVFHNGVHYDVPVIRRLLGIPFCTNEQVWDTFIVSRLVSYGRYRTHSLEEIGYSISMLKGAFSDFSRLSDEMIEYMKKDVMVTDKFFRQKLKRFFLDESWQEAIKVEHAIGFIANEMQDHGFLFNKDRAQELLTTIKKSMEELEAEFQEAWPPSLVEDRRIQYRVKTDGTPFKNVLDTIRNSPKCKRVGSELIVYEYEMFDPASPKKRIDKLWELGWQPTEKTKGHFKFSKIRGKPKEVSQQDWDDRKAKFERYGWTCSEENLATLPEDAPDVARKLTQWLTLDGRRSSLEEWLGCVGEDSRIHGTFWGIGAWTQRMSHSNPNSANIFSPFHSKPKNAVEEIKAKYDGELRGLWITDKWLVGTDADGIQLRILAHYLENPQYVEAILKGNKADGTDIHNVNRRALGDACRSREDAKTFIYAWLLGAGVPKVARILGCTIPMAQTAVQTFIDSTDGLGRLKTEIIPRDAARGYFVGIDGRKVVNDSEYLMLAGYLQNGESCVMKHACKLWHDRARAEGIRFNQVNYVHDEWQTEVETKDEAVRLGEIQREAITEVGERLKLFCPLSGETKIGKSWLETH